MSNQLEKIKELIDRRAAARLQKYNIFFKPQHIFIEKLYFRTILFPIKF